MFVWTNALYFYSSVWIYDTMTPLSFLLFKARESCYTKAENDRKHRLICKKIVRFALLLIISEKDIATYIKSIHPSSTFILCKYHLIFKSQSTLYTNQNKFHWLYLRSNWILVSVTIVTIFLSHARNLTWTL